MMMVFDRHDLAIFEKIYLEVCDELGSDPDASSTPSQCEVLAQLMVDEARRWNPAVRGHRPPNVSRRLLDRSRP